MVTGAELSYTTNVSALTLAKTIFGEGVTVVDASMNVPNTSTAKGLYAKGQLSAGTTPSNSGVILSTGDVRSYTQSNGDPNRSDSTSADTNGTDNDAGFNAIAGATTFDGVWLDVDFIPTGSYMTMSFTFSSEEYPEYVNSEYNDLIGVWVNGTHVPIQVGNGTVSVNNINTATQENLVLSNLDDSYNTEMDGFTITLSLNMQVNPDVVNSIRIGIADATDSNYDSNLLIGADSVQTQLVALLDEVTYYPTDTVNLDVLGNDIKQAGTTLTITHINGVAVTAGQLVTLPSGQLVTLNADGTLTVVGDGQTESKSFSYAVKDTLGNTASGTVTLNQVPCFVAGTRIRTPTGEVPVESLRPGDLVQTLDDGPQPVRWIGSVTVAAAGPMAPVHIRAGTFGPHRRLALSPQHRVLIRDSLAELLFGEQEVLVAAKDLVNGRSVTRREGGEVTYVHVMFDRHQVICSEGLATESYLPGPQTLRGFDDEVIDEVMALFPDFDPATGRGFGTAVRRMLKGHEAQALLRIAQAAA